MNKKALEVVQVNVQCSAVVVAQINQLIRERNLKLVAIQEPYFTFNNVRGFPLSHLLIKPKCDVPMVAIICSKELDPIILSEYSDSHILVISFRRAKRSILLINVYCQFSDDIDTYLERMQNVLNAKSPVWCSDSRDDKGRLLEDFIYSNGLVCLNAPGQPCTFSTVNGGQILTLLLQVGNCLVGLVIGGLRWIGALVTTGRW